MQLIDINCDMGESFGNWRMGDDEAIMQYITAANVACGFHAGDPVTMERTVALAKQHNVTVGAHPGLPDLLGFGRRVMAISPEEARGYFLYQVGALQGILRAYGMALSHVKTHGALYSMVRTDIELARAVAQAIKDVASDTAIYWPAPTSNAAFPEAARQLGLRVIGELYVDLDYAADGSLVLQRQTHYTDPNAAGRKVAKFLQDGTTVTNAGTEIPVDATSICVHGDNPNAVDVLKAIHRSAEAVGVVVARGATTSAQA